MSRIGTTELLFIFGIVLIVFGPSRLPVIGKMAGKTFGQLKEYADKMSEEIDGIEEVVKEPLKSIEKEDSSKSEMKTGQVEEVLDINEVQEVQMEQADKNDPTTEWEEE